MTIQEAIDILTGDNIRPEDIADQVTPTDIMISVHCLQDAQRIQRERIGPFALLSAEVARRAALLEQNASLADLATELRDLERWCNQRAREDGDWREEP